MLRSAAISAFAARRANALMLMDAPPPTRGSAAVPARSPPSGSLPTACAAPAILAAGCTDRGLVLLEDFGDARVRDWPDEQWPADEDARSIPRAVDALLASCTACRPPDRSWPMIDAAYDLREARSAHRMVLSGA
jgi:aminoglycoside/choline kinase family phosphotransferase